MFQAIRNFFGFGSTTQPDFRDLPFDHASNHPAWAGYPTQGFGDAIQGPGNPIWGPGNSFGTGNCSLRM
jgi:hypothetical protein